MSRHNTNATRSLLEVSSPSARTESKENAVFLAATGGFAPLKCPKTFRPRVLIVDDQPIAHIALSEILEAQGFTCCAAESGFEAIQSLRESLLPDVIITDVHMPGMSGYELLAIVRRRFPRIGLIAMSGDYIVEVRPHGPINAFFTKGLYDPAELVRMVRAVYQDISLQLRHHVPDQLPLRVRREELFELFLICPECLRAFPLPTAPFCSDSLGNADCPSCGARVPYFYDGTTLLEPPSPDLRSETLSDVH